MKNIFLSFIIVLFFSTAPFAANLLPSSTTIIPADTLGSELITVEADRTFASDTGWWGKNAGATISGGTANLAAVTNTGLYKAVLSASVGKVYDIAYMITSYTSGAITVYIGASSAYTTHTTTGTFTERMLCLGLDPTIRISSISIPGTASVDNVSLKEVTWAASTKSYHNGTSFVQNITGTTISGDIAGVLSIISGPGANGKAYQIANTGSVDVVVTLTTSKALTVGRHYRPVVIAKRTVGTGTPTYKLTGGTAVSITSSTFTPLAAPAVATNTTDKPTFTVPAGCTIQFYQPKLLPIISHDGDFRRYRFGLQY